MKLNLSDLYPTSDSVAVNNFACAMDDKMRVNRSKGRSGWQECPVDRLWIMLREHVEKGDPVDVANLAMMIWHNGQREQSNPAPEAGERR